ncbi:MAG: hypothetical protein H6718_02940 [Polyangiaceae bacterium]|nr:hypothetical protein [Myxococcales bacterium]MCB9584323.1 hypothetical protein [Polyangiaceae bacterium]
MVKRIAVSMLLGLAAAGCGSSDDSGSGGGGIDLSEFGGYCKGTLLVDLDVQVAVAAGTWSGNSLDDFYAPAGTEFLVSPSFDKWRGYVAYKDGNAGKLDDDFSTGLIKDQDFTSDCAVDAYGSGIDVLMKDSHFYANEAQTGAPCVLPAGTQLEQLSFINTSEVATVSAAAIRTECGFDTAYSSDIVYAELLPL